MAGVSLERPSRRKARAAAAASATPAIDAAAARAAAERSADPVDQAAIAGASSGDQAAAIAATDAIVDPEPALVARPGAPMPIVTASPPVAAEPSASDVVRAETAAIAAGSPVDPAPDREAPHQVAAGQPMIAIEPSAASRRDVPGRSIDQSLAALGRAKLDEEAIARGLSPLGAGPSWLRVEVVGPAKGRRRAGFAFGPEPRVFRGDEISASQLAAFRADPQLTVGVTDADADEVLR